MDDPDPVAAFVPYLAFVLLKIPLPLTIVQILAVDLGTDIVPALGLDPTTPPMFLQLPLIATHPQDLTVREFETATFSVTVSAGTGLSYRWQRNGVDVPGAAGAGMSFTIPSAAVSDDGAAFRVRIQLRLVQ